MKIAMVTGEYPPMQGGVGDFTSIVGRHLALLGHDVSIITRQHALFDEQNTRGEIPIYPLFAKWNWRDIRALRAFVMKHQFDVVNIQYQASAYNMRHPAVNVAPRWLRKKNESGHHLPRFACALSFSQSGDFAQNGGD